RLAVLLAVAAIMHGDGARQQHEHFGAVIHVPDVRPVGPMQAHGRAFDLGDREGIPRLGGGKIARAHKLNGPGSSTGAKRPVSSFCRGLTGIVTCPAATSLWGKMARKLDQTDQHILTLLAENARQSVKELARRIGLSRS